MPVLPPVSVFVLDVCRSSLALPCDGVLSSAEQHSRVSELVECVRCGVLEYAYLARPYPEVQSGNQQPLSVIAIDERGQARVIVRSEMFLASFHRTLLQQLASTFQPKPSSDQLSARQPSTDQQPRQPLAASHISSALSLAVKLQTAGDLTSRRLVFVSTDFNSSSYTRHIRVIRDQVQQLRLVGVETEAVFLSSRTNVTSEAQRVNMQFFRQLLACREDSNAVCECEQTERTPGSSQTCCTCPKHKATRSLPAIVIGAKTAVMEAEEQAPQWPTLGPSTSQLIAIHQCEAATIECHALKQPFYALEAINPDRRVQLLRPLLDGLRRQAAALVLRLEGSKPSVSSGFATLTAYYVLVPLISNKAVGLLREVACRESITSVRVEPLLLPGLGVCEPRLGRPTRDERLPGPLDEEVEDSLVGVVPTLDGGVDHRMAVYGGYVRRLDEMIARKTPLLGKPALDDTSMTQDKESSRSSETAASMSAAFASPTVSTSAQRPSQDPTVSMSSRLATFARQNSLSGSDIYSSRFKDNETAPFRNSMQWLSHTFDAQHNSADATGHGSLTRSPSAVAAPVAATDVVASVDGSKPDLMSEDIPPPPDPKEHPGGKTGGLIDRVLSEEQEAADYESQSEEKLRLRQEGLVRRIVSAL